MSRAGNRDLTSSKVSSLEGHLLALNAVLSTLRKYGEYCILTEVWKLEHSQRVLLWSCSLAGIIATRVPESFTHLFIHLLFTLMFRICLFLLFAFSVRTLLWEEWWDLCMSGTCEELTIKLTLLYFDWHYLLWLYFTLRMFHWHALRVLYV